jgi:hypothetical protein
LWLLFLLNKLFLQKKERFYMKRAILFGAGMTAIALFNNLKSEYNVICAIDNDVEKHGKELLPGITILDKSVLLKEDYDVIIISSYVGLEEITEQLIKEFRVPEDKIISQYVEPTIRAKYTFLESFSKIVYAKGIQGDVCEAGVYRGSFAKEINRCFPDRRLYLFDTFEGYDRRDVEIERQREFSKFVTGSLSMTSEEIVISKMPYPKQCIINKGYFPDTFNLENNTFCFVNIDFDLYQPILSALKLFYPRMSAGGIILIHDYMWEYDDGAAAAVDEFAEKHGLGIIPIGDGVSVAIVKNC